MTNIFQAPLLTDFLYPFVLMFVVTYAILQKSKLFGDNQQQINAIVGIVVALIFVSAAGYVGFAKDMILFMSVGVVVIFVGMVLWGFLSGNSTIDFSGNKPLGIFLVVVIFLGVVTAIFVSLGIAVPFWNSLQTIFNWIFHSSWSSPFWTNAIIVLLIIGSIVAVMKGGGGSGSSS